MRDVYRIIGMFVSALTLTLTLATLATTSACGDDDDDDGGAIDAGPPVITNVEPFAASHIYFAGADNRREIDAPATFPETTSSRVILHLTLACPNNRCDPWDRVGSIGLVEGEGEAARVLEIARFVTPYGVGGTWQYDVTHLQPLLRGTRTMRAFIDTWVGPGSQYGDGWLLTARFELESGRAARQPVQVIPLGWKSAVYGDPLRTVAAQLPPASVTLPATGFSQAEVVVITTGHGQGNAGNCAEFCSREHTITVDGTAHNRTIWRDDCAQNPVNNQQGTWMYPRAGWCPGADVKPWIEDLGTALAPGATVSIGYDVAAYENTCRPEVTTCTGCTLGTGCEFDGGAHTEPFYMVSGFLVLFE